ncbi:MAG TPA: hypothetical protein VN540_02130 [Clostridia bacterium]|nr:hypothetical protein [Clostridia bacterium]
MRKATIVCAEPFSLAIQASSFPEFTKGEFDARIRALRARMKADGIAHAVIYADREHFTNVFFLTGYDPRFEEALLIVSADESRVPTIVVGNEGYDYSFVSPLELRRVLYQNFSLQGQPRHKLVPLGGILADAGIEAGTQVGVIGFKYFEPAHIADSVHMIDIPAYILRHIEEATGVPAVNYTSVMTEGVAGLRMVLGAKQIAVFEYAANQSSNRLVRMLQSLKPGITEIGISAAAGADGLPLSVHPNINVGADHLAIGLRSPDYTVFERGMPAMVSAALRGSLVCRSGLGAYDERDYRGGYEGALESFITPFFETVAAWIESIRIGACAGDIYSDIRARLAKAGIVSLLNPGHSIAEDEWTNSVFFENSPYRLTSGMYIQSDIIGSRADGAPLTGIFEDGYVLADEALRAELAESYPETWERIQRRRRFMTEVVGMKLSLDVLPMSNTCGIYHPFMMNGSRIFALREE